MVAADSGESSYGTYCYPNDIVRDEHMFQCLGDLFSISWMRQAAIHSPETYTLDDHFSDIKALVNKSTVRRFGDLSIGKELLSKFLGEGRAGSHHHE